MQLDSVQTMVFLTVNSSNLNNYLRIGMFSILNVNQVIHVCYFIGMYFTMQHKTSNHIHVHVLNHLGK